MTPEDWLVTTSVLAAFGLAGSLAIFWNDAHGRFDQRDDDRCGYLEMFLELRRREQRRQKWARFRIGR